MKQDYTLQSITTKFCGPTDHRGDRIIARAAAGKIIVPWDYALSVEDNHRAAAQALKDKLDWQHGPMFGGCDYRGEYVWVILHNQN